MKVWLRNWVVSLDIFLNAVTGGKRIETMSVRAARAQGQGKRWGCVMCRVLHWLVERDHCAKALAVGDGDTQGWAALRAAAALVGLALLVDWLMHTLWRWAF